MPAEVEAPPAEPTPIPEAQPARTPVAEVFQQALDKRRVEEKSKPAPKKGKEQALAAQEPSKEPEQGKVAAKLTKEPTEAPAKPASAIEAALAEPMKGDVTDPDPLADLDPVKPDWAKAREKIKHLDAERIKFRDEAQAAKTPDPKSQEQIENLTRERDEARRQADEMKDAIVAVNIEMEPSFRREFIDGRKALVGKAVDKLKAYGGDGEALKDALSLPEGRVRDKAVEAAMGEIGDVPNSKVVAIIGEIEKLDERKSEQLADPNQSWEKLQQGQAATRQKAAEQAEARKKEIWEKVTKDAMDKHPLLRLVGSDVPDAEAWNTPRINARNRALELHSPNATPEQTLEIAFKGELFDHAETLLIETRSENKALRAQLAEYESSQPDIKGNRTPPKGDEKLTPVDKYFKALEDRQGKGEEA